MKLGKFFKPTYSKLLLVLCGILIGITPQFEKIYIKVLLFALAVGLAVWSDMIRRKEIEKR